jgi:hypothetical protein
MYLAIYGDYGDDNLCQFVATIVASIVATMRVLAGTNSIRAQLTIQLTIETVNCGGSPGIPSPIMKNKKVSKKS